jgi:peptide/nickel transport system ATP-binding protein
VNETVLDVRDLNVIYRAGGKALHAVTGATFSIARGERFGMVGESGSGKSTTALALLRLLPSTAAVSADLIRLASVNLTTWDAEMMRAVRGRQIALVPQGAMNSLNPVVRVSHQMADLIRAHEGSVSRAVQRERVEEALRTVGLPPQVSNLYPHQLSGGMKQRVCIAMATLLRPQLIIADEPTSALDVVTQQLVAQTLIEVQEKLNAAILLIGHDMGLQAQLVDRLAVMYAGTIVENAPVNAVFHQPRHPYTQLLISFIPSIRERKPPRGLPGAPPRLTSKPRGCVFQARCPVAVERCSTVAPPLREVQPGHFVACHLVT